jgi:hypothetical protein
MVLMEALIGVALAIIAMVSVVLCLLAARRWRRGRTRIAGSHDSGVPVDMEAWAEIVRRLKNSRADDEPDGGSRASGSR